LSAKGYPKVKQNAPSAYLTTILTESIMLQARREIAFSEWLESQTVTLNDTQWVYACNLVEKGEAFDCALASVLTNPWLK
jgi:hypothetical protein